MSSTTIQKCFRKAGILDRDFVVMKRGFIDHDPFEDLDEELDTSDLQTLISQVQQDNSCSVEEFVNGDQDLQTSINIYGEEWSEEFLNSLPVPSLKACSDPETAPALDDMEVTEEQEEEEGSCEPKLKNLKEAIQCTKDVLCFLDNNGYTVEANQASQLLDSVHLLCVNSRNLKQTYVTDYFNK